MYACPYCRKEDCEEQTVLCPNCEQEYHENMPFCPFCGQVLGKYSHINVYIVTRHYGGPEEGGWWYNAGVPIASYLLSDNEDPDKAIKKLEKKYNDLNEGDIYSVLGGQKVEIWKEYRYGKVWPEHRPHYE